MSEPTGYVIIEEGRYEYYPNKWGQISVYRDVFWGMEETISWIRSRYRPRIPPTREAKVVVEEIKGCYCGCEVIIDLDHHQLMFTPNHFIEHWIWPFERLYEHLLSKMWDGWQIRVDPDYSESDFLRFIQPETFDVPSNGNLAPDDANDAGEFSAAECVARRQDEDYWTKQGADFLSDWLSIRFANADIFDYAFITDIDWPTLPRLLQEGPPLIDLLKDAKSDVVPAEYKTACGAHLDLAKQCLYFWESRYEDRIHQESRLAKRWSGWNVRRLEQGWFQQMQATQRNFPDKRLTDRTLVKWILYYLIGFRSLPYQFRDMNELIQYHQLCGWFTLEELKPKRLQYLIQQEPELPAHVRETSGRHQQLHRLGRVIRETGWSDVDDICDWLEAVE